MPDISVNQHLLQSVDAVLDLGSLAPSAKVNETFSRLVDDIVHANDDVMLTTQKSRQLRNASASAEGKLEEYWAKRIIASPDPICTLSQFPYIDNYYELVKREMECLRQSGLSTASIRTALVIGSGPLPLTAMQMQTYGTVVDHNDASSSALTLCENLLGVLRIAGDHLLGMGETVALEKQYDLILIAALAGETQVSKQAIIDNVLPYLVENGRLLVRSAKGARGLLYPELDASAFRGVTLLHEYHPNDHVINSVLVYGKEEK